MATKSYNKELLLQFVYVQVCRITFVNALQQDILQIWFRFMVFNATFNNISVIYHGGQFYKWRKPESPENIIVVITK